MVRTSGFTLLSSLPEQRVTLKQTKTQREWQTILVFTFTAINKGQYHEQWLWCSYQSEGFQGKTAVPHGTSGSCPLYGLTITISKNSLSCKFLCFQHNLLGTARSVTWCLGSCRSAHVHITCAHITFVHGHAVHAQAFQLRPWQSALLWALVLAAHRRVRQSCRRSSRAPAGTEKHRADVPALEAFTGAPQSPALNPHPLQHK